MYFRELDEWKKEDRGIKQSVGVKERASSVLRNHGSEETNRKKEKTTSEEEEEEEEEGYGAKDEGCPGMWEWTGQFFEFLCSGTRGCQNTTYSQTEDKRKLWGTNTRVREGEELEEGDGWMDGWEKRWMNGIAADWRNTFRIVTQSALVLILGLCFICLTY